MQLSITYKGFIQWKQKCYENPLVSYSVHLTPAQDELVVVKVLNFYIVIPYSNQEHILGVVTGISEPA